MLAAGVAVVLTVRGGGLGSGAPLGAFKASGGGDADATAEAQREALESVARFAAAGDRVGRTFEYELLVPDEGASAPAGWVALPTEIVSSWEQRRFLIARWTLIGLWPAERVRAWAESMPGLSVGPPVAFSMGAPPGVEARPRLMGVTNAEGFIVLDALRSAPHGVDVVRFVPPEESFERATVAIQALLDLAVLARDGRDAVADRVSGGVARDAGIDEASVLGAFESLLAWAASGSSVRSVTFDGPSGGVGMNLRGMPASRTARVYGLSPTPPGVGVLSLYYSVGCVLADGSTARLYVTLLHDTEPDRWVIWSAGLGQTGTRAFEIGGPPPSASDRPPAMWSITGMSREGPSLYVDSTGRLRAGVAIVPPQ